jgi:hypothetical protein
VVVPNGGDLRARREVVQPVLEMRQLVQENDLRVPPLAHGALYGRRELGAENSNVMFSAASLPMLLLLKSHYVDFNAT